MPADSTGQPISLGDLVRHRGQLLTVAGFITGAGRFGTAGVLFAENEEMGDEISVDLVTRAADIITSPDQEPSQ